MRITAVTETTDRRSRDSLSLQICCNRSFNIGSIEVMLLYRNGCRTFFFVIIAILRRIIIVGNCNNRNCLINCKGIRLSIFHTVSCQIRTAKCKCIITVRRERHRTSTCSTVRYSNITAAAPSTDLSRCTICICNIESYAIRIKITLCHSYCSSSGILVIFAVSRIIQIPGYRNGWICNINL